MLTAKNITKKFSGIAALSDVSVELYPGKVTAIIGENGAGKSTLMKILSGVYTQYDGEMILNGTKVKFNNTREAQDAGIAIIHQELNLVPYLSIAENIFLGREITQAFDMVNGRLMNAKARELLQRLEVQIDPATPVHALKVGQQQLVEIAKALYLNASVIIMDEPTSALSDKEVTHLFSIIAQLKKEGKTIVYISHKLNELFVVADRFVVLRDGALIESGEMQAISQDMLIQKMTSRKLVMQNRTPVSRDPELLLEVSGLTLRNPEMPKRNRLHDVSFSLHKGEILGIYGLMGAGRSELMEVLFGLHPKNASGEIRVLGQRKLIQSPAAAIAAGIALVPEDRKLQGLILEQTIKSNISITMLKQLQRLGIMLSAGKEKKLCKDYIQRLSIKTSSDTHAAKNLSGGNQQKIVLAKWLSTRPAILLLDEPTRGIDINAKAEIYALMKTLAEEGLGILIVSSELPEILAVSDRVLVLCEGVLTADLTIDKASETEILKHAIHKN